MPFPEAVLRNSILALREASPGLVDPLLDALSSVSQRKPLTPEALEALDTALTASRPALYETAAYIAHDVSAIDERVVDLIIGLSRHPKAFVRRNAILCLGVETPVATACEMIAAGLQDNSSLVRIKAADWALRMHLVEALPMLVAAACIEKHARARSEMEYSMAMLRDGYIAKPQNGEFVWLTVLRNGGVGTTTLVKKARIDEIGLDKVAADLRGAP